MRHLLVLIVPFVFINCFANANTYSKHLVSSAAIQVNDIIEINDDSYLLVGSHTLDDGLIINVKRDGSIVWAKRYFMESKWHTNSGFRDIIATSDSCFILCGTIKEKTLSLKIGQNGEIIWQTFFNSNSFSPKCICREESNGNIAIGGSNYSPDGNHPMMVFLDKDGQLIGSQEYTASSGEFSSIRLRSDSTFIAIGTFKGTDKRYKPFVTEISKAGSVNHSYLLENSNNQERWFGSDIQVLGNEYLLYLSGYAGQTLVKINQADSVEWSYTYDTRNDHIGSKLIILNDSCYALSSGNEFEGGYLSIVNNHGILQQMVVAWMDLKGVLQTQDKKHFLLYGNGPLQGVSTSFNHKQGIGLIQVDSLSTPDVECMESNYRETMLQDFSIHELSLSTLPGTSTTSHTLSSENISITIEDGCVDYVGAIDENKNKYDLKVFPNPSTGIIHIESNIEDADLISVYNLSGQMVYSFPFTAGQIALNLTHLPQGIYSITISAKEETLQTSEFLLN